MSAPLQLAAQQTRYKLIDLGTFGRPQSYVNIPNNYAPVLNDRGTVAGWADTPTSDPYPNPNFCFNFDCLVSHAFRSRGGITTDLGALPGGASSAATWISSNGLIAGVSQNGQTDPSFLPVLFPVSHAVLWKNGGITDLDTLRGGYESVALAVNNRLCTASDSRADRGVVPQVTIRICVPRIDQVGGRVAVQLQESTSAHSKR